MSLHQNKRGEWFVRWRENGRNRSKLIGTKKDARDFEDEMRRRRRLSGLGTLDREQDFIAFLDEWWVGYYPTVAEPTRDARRTYAERIRQRFGGYRLCDITTPVVRAWQIEMRAEGVGPDTETKLLSVLSMVFTEAQLVGKAEHNPVAPIKRPPQRRAHRVDPFPPERVERIRRDFLAEGDLDFATMTSLLAYAGPRPHEALALLWSEVTDEGLIFRPSKGGATKPRSTRLLEPLRDDLRAYRSQDLGRVFPWTPRGRFRAYRKKLQALGVPRAYDLRHAFVTLLLQEGRSLPYVAKQLGHKIATCDEVYAHLEHLGEQEVDAEAAIYAARSSDVPRPSARTSTGEH